MHIQLADQHSFWRVTTFDDPANIKIVPESGDILASDKQLARSVLEYAKTTRNNIDFFDLKARKGFVPEFTPKVRHYNLDQAFLESSLVDYTPGHSDVNALLTSQFSEVWYDILVNNQPIYTGTNAKDTYIRRENQQSCG